MLTTETLNSFTLDAYRTLLTHFGQTHSFVTFSEYATAHPQKLILLRHDIDYSLQHALTMAQLEAGLGIRATYFVLFSSPFYNVLAAENMDIPRQIAQLGHEVGLHYDVAVMAQAEDPQALLRSQAGLLSELCGAEVRSIAMHNPSISGADIFRAAPYINAYDDRFSKQIAYFSDSCMAWRDAFVAACLADAMPARMQLLIHPCLWTEHEQGRMQKLEAIHTAVSGGLLAELERSRAIWTNHAGVREHEARLKPKTTTQSAVA
jgi:hypothetical protein